MLPRRSSGCIRKRKRLEAEEKADYDVFALSVEQLAQTLRNASPPVLARKHDDRLLIDFRTLLPRDEDDLERILAEAGSQRTLDRAE